MTRSSSRRRSSTGPSSSSPVCARTSPSPTSPATPTPPSSSRASTPCSTRCARAACRPASCTRATPPARSTGPAARFDMVRVGIGCYGIAPADELEGRVDAAAGDVGEGARVAREGRAGAARGCRTGCATRPTRETRIATVPIGYADGVPRELPHRGGEAIVRGRRCPIAGTVTMDQLMLDVGDLAGGGRRRGRADRPAGRRGDHRRVVGARDGHDRVHDRVRHRTARAAGVRSPGEPEPRAGVGEGSRASRGRRPRALAGAGYAGQRVLASRLRHRPDGDAARALDAPVYVDRRLDAFDGGSIYLVETGEGPPIVLSHGVTNSIRSWFHQLESLPERRLPHDRVRPPWSRPVDGRHRRPLAREPRRGHAHRRRGARPARRGARRPLDGRRRGAGVRDAVPGDRGRAGRGHRVALDARQGAVRIALDAHEEAHRGDHEPRARHELGVDVARTSASCIARLGLRQAIRTRATSSSCARCCATARPRRGSTRRAR